MKTVEKDRENFLTISVFEFFFGNGSGNGKDGRENESDITEYQ